MIDERENPQQFAIDDLTLDSGKRKLFRNQQLIQLPKLSFDLFLALIRAAPNVVSTDDLVNEVWGDVVVNDETVTQRVKMLRDALAQDDDKQHYVETVRSIGYRLRPEVTIIDAGPVSPGEPTASTIKLLFGSRMVAFTILTIVIVAVVLYFSLDSPQKIAPKERSIAVLPFVAMSDGPDDGYFADGLTEEILNSLAQLPELLVTARTSSFFFKGKNVPVPEIAKTLGVAHIVEGSIRRDSNQLRITAQLVRAEDGFHVWSETFEHTSDEIFAVQIDIAEKVAAALDIVLDEDLRRRMRGAGVHDPEAFIGYQKGLELFDRAHGSNRTLDLLAEANVHFEHAIERAPDFSKAYVHHSDYYSHLLLDAAAGADLVGVTDEDLVHARKILLDDFDAAVRHAQDDKQRLNAELDRAVISGDWRDLAGRINRVLTASGCATPIWLNFVSLPYGNAEASRTTVTRRVECDPLDLGGQLHQLRLLMWLGEFDATIVAAMMASDVIDNPLFEAVQVAALIAMGRKDDAEALIESGLRDEVMTFATRFWLAASQSDVVSGRRLIERYRDRFGTSAADLRYFHVLLGDRAAANWVAAKTDARPFGYLVLAQAILTCYCGAPFDLEATPNFARMIEESDLAWPPTTPIKWPLKTW